uniref:Acyltransferase 3 domain-containing protein n=1 Tax=Peronospora matthiolae TaxID=2874970 RepID=A0AAV1V1A3_9STRA
MLQKFGRDKVRESHEGAVSALREEAVRLQVRELGDDEAGSTTSSDSKESTVLDEQSNLSDPDSLKAKTKPLPPPAKVLFLDGIRGLAAMLVVVQHSEEFYPSLHLGSVGVDAFFILSSFLLTWLFLKKSMKLIARKASIRTWAITMLDYFQKRFFRVYPLFALTAIVLRFLPFEYQRRFFIVGKNVQVDLFKMLTFDYDQRFYVFWTLPLEIAYYLIIPVFVLVTIGMRRYWLVGAVPALMWVVHEGWTYERQSHMPLRPHIHTFVMGSLAAVVYVKLDLLIKKTNFKMRWWHEMLMRVVEGLTVSLLLSVCFRGLLFDWVVANPAAPPNGFPFSSVFMALVIVIEMILPSCVSTMFEWNVFRFWGKISFSIYLLHTFVINCHPISVQPYFFNRVVARLVLIIALATLSYHLVEYPSQLLAQRTSRFLAAREKIDSVSYSSVEKVVLKEQGIDIKMK